MQINRYGIEYFYELFVGLPRGESNDNKLSNKALLFLKKLSQEPLILDIKCRHGMQTLESVKL